jgi:hypothetical protein
MVSSGLLRRVALVRTDVSEELSTLVFLRSVRWLLVTANVVPSSPILVTLMNEALSSSEISALTTATWRNIPEDTSLHIVKCVPQCREDGTTIRKELGKGLSGVTFSKAMNVEIPW